MAEAPLSPEEIAHRSFPTSFRGFATGEVRDYLARVADELRAAGAQEREWQRRLTEAEHRAAHPVLDQATLSRAVGEEMARLLASAQEAAQELKAKAEEKAGRILREAHDHAQRVRDDAESVLARRTAEAGEAAGAIRAAAEAERAALLERTQRDAEAKLVEVEARSRSLVDAAEVARDQVLTDLGRRRRMVNAQVQQLRAGRERLLDAYRVVRRTLDEVSEELERVEVEARAVAGETGRRPLEETDAVEPDRAPPVTAVAVAPQSPPTPDEPRPPPAPPAPRLPSALRVVRTPDVVHPPAAVEGVRVVVSTPVPAAAVAASPAGSVVEDLFARMRAERAESVAQAHEVLATQATPTAQVSEPEPPPVDNVVGAGPVEGGDEALRERRDAAVEAAQSQLVRRLKRALQDEQNEALDRLRAGRSGAGVAVLVPPDEQSARLRDAALALLEDAFSEGARFVVADASPVRAVGPAVAELTSALAGPLRRALEVGLAGGDDDAGLVDRIGAAYRECRAQRVERAASDAVVDAFSRGTLAAATGALRWVMDDDGAPCADCDDNALAGPTVPGEAYPTGQVHPPAHVGCRCLLVPAT